MNEYQEIMLRACEIAEEAASVALSYFRQALLIESKSDLSPVTIADRRTEEKIRSELESAFPGHGIIGEEFGTVAEGSDYVWTVDPIDGTRSFVRGIPLFGTLLGLLHKGEPVVGIMVLPALEETYTAAKGIGAYCGSHRLHVSNTKTLDQAVLSCGDYDAFIRREQGDQFLKLFQSSAYTRNYTDCFGHSLLLQGAVDAMVDPVVAIWDIVPIACLLKEAGGVYFSMDDSPVFQTKGLSSFVGCSASLEGALKKCLKG